MRYVRRTALSADACAQITAFPSYSPSLLESIGVAGYPVPFSWTQECSGESGSAVFTAQFQQVRLGDLSTDCPIIVELGGGDDVFALRWY